MKLYFSDNNNLNNIYRPDVSCMTIRKESGSKSNLYVANILKDYFTPGIISDDMSLLNSGLFWSKEKNEHEIYLFKNNRWQNINLLTDKILQKDSDILHMYIAGEFSDKGE